MSYEQHATRPLYKRIDLFYIPDLILNLYSFILLLYDVSSFATLTMVLSLASDGQVNEFECNFDLQKNKQ